ncbi:hypothetical protein COO91_10793 (plasmid) [Nostoc flagelliforme CCNUN1]|uniref:Uncharacterized protein n=2 Tax=Nostoc flagelliforme TaxID=1306274 RepID=A0A2K8T348_9NOSO|nr:hypothetical protein [Nostoc flagelliforme]AUB42013.1 hypothetical protein COO91_08111 [Nostoc flagelliforme CCNUN1]AUB44557.1 hypothetical protein COO91_10793 [Nostoc flagelliforme CCNUN1]
MPQTTATLTSCVKPVEELRSVEISFEDHEFYAGQKLVASITHDDDLTQPWIVMVNGEEIHRANTFKRCHSYITWHYQRGTLPIQEETPVATTGNEVMCSIAAQCEQFGFELLDDGIYKDEQKLGSIGCTEGKWWVIRATSVHQQKVPCDSVREAVWSLSMVEITCCEDLLDRPFDQLTTDQWRRLVEYQPRLESRELVAA